MTTIHRGYAVVCRVFDNNLFVLLQKVHVKSLGRSLWMFPGGRFNSGNHESELVQKLQASCGGGTPPGTPPMEKVTDFTLTARTNENNRIFYVLLLREGAEGGRWGAWQPSPQGDRPHNVDTTAPNARIGGEEFQVCNGHAWVKWGALENEGRAQPQDSSVQHQLLVWFQRNTHIQTAVFQHMQGQPQQGAGAQPTAPGAAQQGNSRPVCRNFKQGSCRWGAACRFSHDLSQAAGGAQRQEVCRDFAKGSCRRGASCRFLHSDAGSGGGGGFPVAPPPLRLQPRQDPQPFAFQSQPPPFSLQQPQQQPQQQSAFQAQPQAQPQAQVQSQPQSAEQQVATSFVNHYFTLLRQDPSQLAGLYLPNALWCHEGTEAQGQAVIARQLAAGRARLLAIGTAPTPKVDCQASSSNGLVIHASGAVPGAQGATRFALAFVLVHNGSWSVQNEVLRML